MATQAHCAYCFEALAACFEDRQILSLAQVEQLWEQYHASTIEAPGPDMDDAENDQQPRSVAISRLLNQDRELSAASPSSTSTQASTPSSNQESSGADSTTSSRSSLFSLGGKGGDKKEAHPLFVTWNTLSRSGQKSLRGCIGTFEARELDEGLRSYATTSAFEDSRFSPITAALMPSLSNHVTLLTNFSTPTRDPLDWTLGIHGLRISFTYHGRRYGATYLPDVAKEQGWTKEEAVVSLMRKAGWNGSSSNWQKTWKDGSGELVRYEGEQVGLEYAEWKEWRDWVGA